MDVCLWQVQSILHLLALVGSHENRATPSMDPGSSMVFRQETCGRPIAWRRAWHASTRLSGISPTICQPRPHMVASGRSIFRYYESALRALIPNSCR